MRTTNSMKNIATGWGFSLVTTVTGFVSRTVFIAVLGKTFLGLSGLFANVLTMLSLSELGFGTAMVFALYKPLADHDTETVKALMRFYERAYRIIGIVVAALGVVMVPFLPLLIKEHDSIYSLYWIYGIYVFNSAYTYFFSYKRALMSANQKGYHITLITTVTKLLTNGLQIAVLLGMRFALRGDAANLGHMQSMVFIAYLLTQTAVSIGENLYVNAFIDRRNPFLRQRDAKPLAPDTHRSIIKNVQALVYHKLGDFCMYATDNMIVSVFLNLQYVGMLNNYVMITATLSGLVANLFNGLSASLGNLVAKENEEKRLRVFDVMLFVSTWVYGAISVALLCLLTPMVNLWLGPHYLLGRLAVAVMAVNFYLTGLRIPFLTIKNAAGIYRQDRFVPVVQSVLNIVLSIVLAGPLGVAGVLLGTAISNLSLSMWYRPILVYRLVFGRSAAEYFRKTILGSLLVLFWAAACFWACQQFRLENVWLDFLARFAIATLPPNALALALFRRQPEFLAARELVVGVFARRGRRP